MNRGCVSVLAAFWVLLCGTRSARSDNVEELVRKLRPQRSGIQIAFGRILQQPQVAVDRKGRIHVVCGGRDTVYYAASADGGATCDPLLAAFDCRNLSLGRRRGPRIAVSDGTVVVTAIGGEKGKGQDGDLQAWRREENGRWSGPVRVNDVAGSAREGLHGMASGPDGTIWCVWLDLRDKGTSVYGARSSDGGRTWGENVLVYRYPGKSVCECCHPSVAVGPENHVAVLFRNSIGGNRDMFVTRSIDGQTFDAGKPVAARNWKLAACPMDGGMLALSPRGDEAWAIYRREQKVYLTAFQGDAVADGKAGAREEELLGSGDQPTVTALTSGPLSVWTNSGDLMIREPGDENSRRLAQGARFPSAASDPSGQLAAVVWEQAEQELSAIRLEVFPAVRR